MRTFVALLLLSLPLCAADTLVLTDAGYQIMTVGPNGAVLTPVAKVDRIVDLRTGAPQPPPGDTPAPPNIPPRAGQVETLSRAVGDADGAMGWAAVCRAIRDSLGENSSLPEEQWKRLANVTLSGVSSQKKEAWTNWLKSVNALSDGKYDRVFFQHLEAGLTKAYGLDSATVGEAVAAAKSEATAEQAGLPETMQWIIQLVTFILEMLRQFGII